MMNEQTMKQLAVLVMAVKCDDKPTNPNAVLEQIVQIGDEISRITKECSREDQILAHNIVFQMITKKQAS
jgi:hypothetical protein